MTQTVGPPDNAASDHGSAPAVAAATASSARAEPREQSKDAGRTGDRKKDEKKDEEKRQKAVAAADKELLSWTRLSMSLATTGIAAERGLAYVESFETGRRLDPSNILHTLALCLVGLGVGSLLMACLQAVRVRTAFRRGEPLPEPLISLPLVVAVGVICIFLVALVTVLSFRDVLKSTGAGLPANPALASAPPVHEPVATLEAGGVGA